MNAYELAQYLEVAFYSDEDIEKVITMLRQQADQLDKVIPQLVKANGIIENLRIRIAELEKENNSLQDHMTELRKIHTERIEAMEKALMLAGETKWDIVKDGKIIESNYTHPVKQLLTDDEIAQIESRCKHPLASWAWQLEFARAIIKEITDGNN